MRKPAILAGCSIATFHYRGEYLNVPEFYCRVMQGVFMTASKKIKSSILLWNLNLFPFPTKAKRCCLKHYLFQWICLNMQFSNSYFPAKLAILQVPPALDQPLFRGAAAPANKMAMSAPTRGKFRSQHGKWKMYPLVSDNHQEPREHSAFSWASMRLSTASLRTEAAACGCRPTTRRRLVKIYVEYYHLVGKL